MKYLPTRLALAALNTLIINSAFASSQLPSELITYIESLENKYNLVKQSDLSPLILQNIEMATAQIISDFDGDNRPDYALLATNQNQFVSVVIFLNRANGFTHLVLLDKLFGDALVQNDIQVFMYPVTGEIEGANSSIQLDYTGIYVSWIFGPTGAVYYWNNNKFESLLISD